MEVTEGAESPLSDLIKFLYLGLSRVKDIIMFGVSSDTLLLPLWLGCGLYCKFNVQIGQGHEETWSVCFTQEQARRPDVLLSYRLG